MTQNHRRLGRLFYCLISVLVVLALPVRAAEPNKTIVAEALFGAKSGTDKKEAALSFVGSALSLTEALSNRDIVDEGKFKDGLSKIIDGTVQCLNASAWAKK
jgi:hypothetical protein